MSTLHRHLIKYFFSLQYPEYLTQGALTALLLLSGNWFAGCVQLIALAYNIHQVRQMAHGSQITGSPSLGRVNLNTPFRSH